MRLVTTRNITPNECYWLNETIEEGSEVFEYYGHTYGCVSDSGIAVTIQDGKDPFFELPTDSLGFPWIHIDKSFNDIALKYFAIRTEGVLQDHACLDCRGWGNIPMHSTESCVRCDGTGKLRHMTHHLENLYEAE